VEELRLLELAEGEDEEEQQEEKIAEEYGNYFPIAPGGFIEAPIEDASEATFLK
jgi:hypothetical protein